MQFKTVGELTADGRFSHLVVNTESKEDLLSSEMPKGEIYRAPQPYMHLQSSATPTTIQAIAFLFEILFFDLTRFFDFFAF